MALDLSHNVLAWQRRSVNPSAQGVHDVAEGFIRGNSIIGIPDPELDSTGYLALILGEGGSVDGDLSWV